MVRGMHDKLSTRDAREVVDAIRKGLETPRDQMPTLARQQRNEANVDAEVDVLEALVTLRSRENSIALQTLASHKDLAAVARGHKDVDVLRGWRREIVGNDLLDFMEGRVDLGCEDGKLVIIRRDDS